MAKTFVFPTDVLNPGEEVSFTLETVHLGTEEALRLAIESTRLLEVAKVEYSFRSITNTKTVYIVRSRILATVTAGQLKEDIESAVNELMLTFGAVVSEMGYEQLTIRDVVTVPVTTSVTVASIAVISLVGIVLFLRLT